eukprot:XP_011662917.1 PREDICTED: uncharacterized protein LOC105437707 [Strongylocentrotus purpuratus]
MDRVALSLVFFTSLCSYALAEGGIQDVNDGENVYRSWSIAVGVLVVVTFIAVLILSVSYFRVAMKESRSKHKLAAMRRHRMLPSEFLPRAHLPARHETHPGLLPPGLVGYDYAYDHRATSIPPPSYRSESHNRATRYGYGSGPPAIDNGLPPQMRFADIDPVGDYNHGPGAMTAIGSALYHTRPSVTRSTVLYNPLARMASEPKTHLVYF